MMGDGARKQFSDAAERDQSGGGKQQPIIRDKPKIKPNDPCPCGSGMKYKKCHGKPGAPPLPMK